MKEAISMNIQPQLLLLTRKVHFREIVNKTLYVNMQ